MFCLILQVVLDYNATTEYAIIPAIIGAAALLGSSIYSGIQSNKNARSAQAATSDTNAMNLQIARETNQANLDLYREQYRDAMALQRDTQWYNSPQNQASMLRAAGLNPALSLGDTNSVGGVSVPSASSMQGATMQVPDISTYSDAVSSNIASAILPIAGMFSQYADYRGKMIDNQTKSAYNDAMVKRLYAELQSLSDSSKLSQSQRELINAQKEGLITANRLAASSYEDKLSQERLQTKFMELQNRVVDEQNSRDNARLALERLKALNEQALTRANIDSIRTMANLAVNADWRASQAHVADMNLKGLDEMLKRVNLGRAEKQAVFEAIMNKTELYHEGLKDASLINRAAERMFGLGFRDLGAAIRNLITK